MTEEEKLINILNTLSKEKNFIFEKGTSIQKEDFYQKLLFLTYKIIFQLENNQHAIEKIKMILEEMFPSSFSPREVLSVEEIISGFESPVKVKILRDFKNDFNKKRGK